MSSLDSALDALRQHARADQLPGMARFGLVGEGRLGVSMPELRRCARRLGRDHTLALSLWDTGIPDARILAGLVADPSLLGARQMDQWANGFMAWDVCDQTCINLFRSSPHAWRKVRIWSGRDAQFVRRAAFALLATLAVHDKAAPDAMFIDGLALIAQAADDERNLVRKAVNWALRAIGKRNPALHAQAVACARRLGLLASRSARWIAVDALRELEGDAVRARLHLDGAT